jgi:diaminohydroxyphosphoribosylaminopyrimidine deaminase/5-amino-6-(5-phosphoribosylamino)uracil reductase
MSAVTDHEFMQRALELAQRGRYTVSPNPMVGCVIVRDPVVIAEGFHRRAGEAHAEVEALRGTDARGATMYVTLEPCSHHGRTPPCADAVIAAGLKRVVVAMEDPNDVVNGRGVAALRAAGIDVAVGVMETEARRLNEKFAWAVSQKLPFVLVKAGMTLDGKLATVARESQWITSEGAREASLRLREEYDAIVVGGGTVKSDDPRLTRRLGLAGEATRWTRVVLDGDGDVQPQAQILNDGGHTILFTAAPARYAASPNLEIVGTEGRVDLERVFGELHARGIRSVIVEGGALVHSEVLRRGLWQKMILFIAPLLVGGAEAPSIFSGEGVPRLTDAYRFRFDRVEQLGTDLVVVAYPA